jgi:hypothetical protein
MKIEITPLAILALISLLLSCEQEPKTQASAGPPPVGEPIEIDNWKIVISELKELPQKTDVELLTGGFNAVLGPRGSPIDLILNAMFHMGSSTGLLSWAQYEEIREIAGVEEAYPIAVGYNYKGYRLVGTLPEMFEEHEWSKGKKYLVKEDGRIFTETGKGALVGDLVARELGLSVGDEFSPYHGLAFDESKRQQETYVVVGLLEATGTPADHVIWVSLQGIQKMEEPDSSAAQSISAVLLSVSGRAGFALTMKYDKQDNQATLAWPATTNINYFLSQTIPAYLSFARQLDGEQPFSTPGTVSNVEEGYVVNGRPKPFNGEEDNASFPGEPVADLPPLEEGSVFKPLAFRDLTNFEYLVEWEADGKDFDFSAYAKRVPSRLREKSGVKVAVEGFMIPTVVDENNKVKEFLLLPDQMSCCFGKSPEANGWVVVSSSDGVEVLMDRIIRVTGTLTVEERWDEEFFVGLYHMDCKDVTGPAL